MKVCKHFTAFFLVVFLMVLSVQTGFAADNSGKVGIVSTQKAVLQSEFGREIYQKLEKKKNEFQTEQRNEEEALLKLQEEIETKKSVWPKDIYDAKQRELKKRFQILEIQNSYANSELQQLEKKLLNPVMGKLSEILSSYARENGYSVIFEAQAGTLYYDEAVDLTDEISAKLDKSQKK